MTGAFQQRVQVCTPQEGGSACLMYRMEELSSRGKTSLPTHHLRQTVRHPPAPDPLARVEPLGLAQGNCVEVARTPGFPTCTPAVLAFASPPRASPLPALASGDPLREPRAQITRETPSRAFCHQHLGNFCRKMQAWMPSDAASATKPGNSHQAAAGGSRGVASGSEPRRWLQPRLHLPSHQEPPFPWQRRYRHLGTRSRATS